MYDIDSHLTDLLIRNGRALWRVFSREIEQIGLNPSDAPILMSLWRKDGRRQVDIAAFVGVEPAALTRPIDRLEKEGLLERRPCPDDRRAWLVHLTAVGKSYEDKVHAARDRIDALAARPFGDSELAKLKKQLVESFANLEKASEGHRKRSI